MKVIINLTKMAKKYRPKGPRAEFVGVVRRLGELNWAHLDLEMVEHAVADILARGEERSKKGEVVPLDDYGSYQDNAASTMAFVRYNLAAQRLDTKKAFNQQQRARHREMVEIRNRILAHAELDAVPSGEWRNAYVVAITEPTGMVQIDVAWKRANYLGAAIVDLASLSALLLQHAEEEMMKVSGRLLELLEEPDAQMFRDLENSIIQSPDLTQSSWFRRHLKVRDGLVMRPEEPA